jgi:hypothetical protein
VDCFDRSSEAATDFFTRRCDLSSAKASCPLCYASTIPKAVHDSIPQQHLDNVVTFQYRSVQLPLMFRSVTPE